MNEEKHKHAKGLCFGLHQYRAHGTGIGTGIGTGRPRRAFAVLVEKGAFDVRDVREGEQQELHLLALVADRGHLHHHPNRRLCERASLTITSALLLYYYWLSSLDSLELSMIYEHLHNHFLHCICMYSIWASVAYSICTGNVQDIRTVIRYIVIR